jgi:hypothetical protein
VTDLRPPPPPRPNLRRHPRYELLASVELHLDGGDETVILPARNLSLGGIFLGHDGHDLSRLEIGSQVELLVFDATNEESPPVRAKAMVVRHDEGGIGLEWKRDPGTSKQVKELLKSAKRGAAADHIV